MLDNLKALIAAIKVVNLKSAIAGEIQVLDVFATGGTQLVVLPKSADTIVPGTQSLFWDNRSGHCVVVPVEQGPNTCTFEVLKTFGKPLTGKPKVWLSGWLGEKPEDFGISNYEQVKLETGALAWLVEADSDRWVIYVHGRKASMGETLRTFPLVKTLGLNQLSVSLKSDPKPYGLGTGESYLGAVEWREIESAVRYAQSKGAKEIYLFGISLGAMIVGQFLLRSKLAFSIKGAIFDSPLIDFPSTLRLQAKLSGMDPKIGDLALAKLQRSAILRILGKARPDVPSLIQNLSKPLLVLYSSNDGYVSMERIGDFKELNPLGRFIDFPESRHCRLFNSNNELYVYELTNFLQRPRI